MNPNAEAIYREFPFIEKYFPLTRVVHAGVERIDERVALHVPKRVVQSNGDYYDAQYFVEDFMLLGKDGNEVGRVGQELVKVPARKILWWTWLPARSFWSVLDTDETVLDAVLRVQKPVHYILLIELREHSVILFKPPKNVADVRMWMVEVRSRARDKAFHNLNAKLREIDSEAELPA